MSVDNLLQVHITKSQVNIENIQVRSVQYIQMMFENNIYKWNDFRMFLIYNEITMEIQVYNDMNEQFFWAVFKWQNMACTFLFYNFVWKYYKILPKYIQELMNIKMLIS